MGGGDGIANNATVKAPKTNSIHTVHVYIQKKSLSAMIRVDISQNNKIVYGWTTIDDIHPLHDSVLRSILLHFVKRCPKAPA